jgi:hypothetical protein
MRARERSVGLLMQARSSEVLELTCTALQCVVKRWMAAAVHTILLSINLKKKSFDALSLQLEAPECDGCFSKNITSLYQLINIILCQLSVGRENIVQSSCLFPCIESTKSYSPGPE